MRERGNLGTAEAAGNQKCSDATHYFDRSCHRYDVLTATEVVVGAAALSDHDRGCQCLTGVVK